MFGTKTTKTPEAISHLSYLFNHFGVPERLVSDRGTAFTAGDFEKFIKQYNIVHVKVAVASPWANGQVERVNRFMKSTLAKTVREPEEWVKILGRVQYIINNTYHKSIDATPSRLFFGYDQRGHSDRELQEAIREMLKIDTEIYEQRAKLRDSASEANRKLQLYNQTYYNSKHRKPSLYREGDLVMIRSEHTRREQIKN